jgi:hypothetical protein
LAADAEAAGGFRLRANAVANHLGGKLAFAGLFVLRVHRRGFRFGLGLASNASRASGDIRQFAIEGFGLVALAMALPSLSFRLASRSSI